MKNLTKNKGLMLVLSSPSGAGKSSICKSLINLDKNVFPEDILIPQEKVKKITKKDVDKIDFKKILNKETEEEDG